MIEIVSNLSADAPSDVFLAEAPPASIGGGYRGMSLGDRRRLAAGSGRGGDQDDRSAGRHHRSK